MRALGVIPPYCRENRATEIGRKEEGANERNRWRSRPRTSLSLCTYTYIHTYIYARGITACNKRKVMLPGALNSRRWRWRRSVCVYTRNEDIPGVRASLPGITRPGNDSLLRHVRALSPRAGGYRRAALFCYSSLPCSSACVSFPGCAVSISRAFGSHVCYLRALCAFAWCWPGSGAGETAALR